MSRLSLIGNERISLKRELERLISTFEKVGSNFFRIKSNRRLAKDPMSGIQLKYFKNQLAKGTNELKWSLVK